MKIAFMTNNYKPFVGGVPISIERLSQGLRALGHEVIIYAPPYENQEDDAKKALLQRSFMYFILCVIASRFTSMKLSRNDILIPLLH